MPVQKVCEQCGTKFAVPPRRAEEVKFCSRECKTAAGRVKLSCGVCGSAFERVRSELRGKDAYCSKPCYLTSQKGQPKAANPQRPRYFKTCEECSKEFRVTLTRKDTARFCSRECQGRNAAFRAECSEKQQGEKHWRWQGGRYKTHEGYIRHKRKVYGKEGFTYNHRDVVAQAMAEQCPRHPFLHEVGGRLRLRRKIDVHHIDRNRENNALDNLLAVTKDAHAQIHHRNRKPDPWECWPPNPTKY